MEPRNDRQVIWLGLLMALAMAAYVIYIDSVFRQFEPPQRPSRRELIARGKRADYHSDLIEKISSDLKLTKDVELIFVPGGPAFPSASFNESEHSFQVLLGEGFFLSLPEPEQRALIGHELGHIIFLVCDDPIHCQMGADLFSAKYTSPEAVISLLEKLSSHPLWTESREYRLRLEHLKLLLPEN